MNALAPFACPRCAVALVPAPQDLVDRGASTCPTCNGLFLDDVRSYRDIESVARPALFEIRRVPDSEAQQEPLPCPRIPAPAKPGRLSGGIALAKPTASHPGCGVDSVMHKGISERDRKVVVDVCPSCGGAWLDGGEVDAIQIDSFPKLLSTLARWIEEA